MRKYSRKVYIIEDSHLQCVNNNYTKIEYKGMNENFWSYRLHKLGTPKDLWTGKQMNGRSYKKILVGYFIC